MTDFEFECSRCQRDFDISSENGIVFLFNQDPAYSYVRLQCTHCEQHHSLVLDTDEIKMLLNLGLPTMVEDEAPDKIKEALEPYISKEIAVVWEAQVGEGEEIVYDVPVYELTDRMEQMVLDLREILCNTPDDLLMDLFSNPPPKSNMPKRWA